MKKNRKVFIICFLILIYFCVCRKLLEKKQENVQTDLIEIEDVSEDAYLIKGNGEIDVEIFSSENYSKRKWMNDVIEKFNEEKNLVNGKVVSVSLKVMSSESMFKNIVLGKCIPDAIAPENQFLTEMLKVKGVEYYEESEVLFENMLGIVIDKSTYNSLLNNKNKIDFCYLQQLMENNQIKMGILDKDVNSLNFIVSVLYSFDSENMLSDIAIEGFEQLKASFVKISDSTYIPNYINNGKLNALILDYSNYVKILELSEYIFIPVGIINNNPLYCNQNISEMEKRVIKLFGYYATSIYSKKLAEDYGFIIKGNYISDIPFLEGETLLEIIEFFNKNI